MSDTNEQAEGAFRVGEECRHPNSCTRNARCAFLTRVDGTLKRACVIHRTEASAVNERVSYKGVIWHASDKVWVRQDIGFADLADLLLDGSADLSIADIPMLRALRDAPDLVRDVDDAPVEAARRAGKSSAWGLIRFTLDEAVRDARAMRAVQPEILVNRLDYLADILERNITTPTTAGEPVATVASVLTRFGADSARWFAEIEQAANAMAEHIVNLESTTPAADQRARGTVDVCTPRPNDTVVSVPIGDAYLIWSYEHGAWWGPKFGGYFVNLLDAGLYTKEAAEGECGKRYAGQRKDEEARRFVDEIAKRDDGRLTVTAFLLAALHADAARTGEVGDA